VGYAPVVVILNRGWFAFKFKKEEELRRILNMNWHLNHSPVLLKPWHPMFDAGRERVDVSPVWVRMPALPLHFWELHHFKRIGDILGTFLEADLSYLETNDQKVARILVSINLREGLAEQINLEWGPEIIPQLLDYENVPFRCRRCHAYGHPATECSLPPRHNSGGRRSHFRSTEGSHQEKGSGSSEFDPSSSEDPGSEPMGDEPGLVCPVVEDNPVAQMDVVPDTQREDSSQGCPKVEESPAAHLDLVIAPQREDAPRGPDIPGIPSFSVPPSVNLFMNSVTILGHDWVEGLRKLSLAGPSGPVAPRNCLSILGEEASCLNSPIKNNSVVSLAECASVLEDSPFVLIEPDPGDSHDADYQSPSESQDSGYFLRSCKKAISSGLGKSSPPARKGRGRKSNLHKAQSRARVDLMEGKQLSIEKALRAVNAKKKGRS